MRQRAKTLSIRARRYAVVRWLMSIAGAVRAVVEWSRSYNLLGWLVVLGMTVLFLVAPIYDEAVPVVKAWHVTNTALQLGELKINGVMEKDERRAGCDTTEFYAIVERRALPDMIVEVRTDKTRIHTRPAGKQSVGPWFVPLPEAAVAVDIFVRHKCWPWINTDSILPVWRNGS